MNWKEEWIQTARGIARERFQSHYASREVDDAIAYSKPNASSTKKHDSDDEVSYFIYSHMMWLLTVFKGLLR
jgi:hypothetical protein